MSIDTCHRCHRCHRAIQPGEHVYVTIPAPPPESAGAGTPDDPIRIDPSTVTLLCAGCKEN